MLRVVAKKLKKTNKQTTKTQGSQITLTLGGHILTVRSEGLLWTVNPRMPFPQEILKPRPLGSDLKSSPELQCDPKSVLTHFVSQVSHMKNNKSICVLVERWMECVQRSCRDLLCFSSMTLNPFLKGLALSPSLIYCVALSQLLDLSGPIFTSGVSGDWVRESLTSNDSPWRMLIIFSSWTLQTNERKARSKSSVFSHCPPLPTVRNSQHWLASQTCCYDNGLQITQMKTKILTQELLGQWFLPLSPHQTKGTIWWILWDQITHLLTSLPRLLSVMRLSPGILRPSWNLIQILPITFPTCSH